MLVGLYLQTDVLESVRGGHSASSMQFSSGSGTMATEMYTLDHNVVLPEVPTGRTYKKKKPGQRTTPNELGERETNILPN